MGVVPGHGRRRRGALLKGAARRALLFASLTPLFTSLSASATAAPAAGAAPLSDYRARMRESVAPLEELASAYELAKRSEKYEVWSREGFDPTFIDELPQKQRAALGRVRGLLPAKERVEWGEGSFVEVDNSWLHAGLDESARGGYEKQAHALRAAAGRLRALEARLAELEGGDRGEATDRDAERGRLNTILRAPEFGRDARGQQGGALRRLLEEFAEWVSGLFPKGPLISPGETPRASLFTQVAVVLLCLAVLAYVARRVWLWRGQQLGPLGLKRGARVVLGERVEADLTAADLLEDAERLARTGDPRGAIRKAYVGLLCELGDRGVLRLANHKTNRDYLEAVRRAARPGLYAELLPVTSDFESHWYGLRDATVADWESFRTRCRRVMGG